MRGLIVFLISCAAVQAAPAEPLRLDAVLAQVDARHPRLLQPEARLDMARAEQALAESLDDVRVSLEGVLRTGRSRLTDDKFQPDNQLRLNLRKPLWDGGRASANSEAARLESMGQEALLINAVSSRRMELMARFFDVLLADLRYGADNEIMAVAYVTWDNAKERHQLGELSTPALAELEDRFQDMRTRRNDSLRRAKETRARLASAMNRPDELPGDIEDPDLKRNDRPLPDFDTLWRSVQQQNPRLRAQRQALAASAKRLEALRGENQPSLEFEAEAAAYTRDAYTRDDLRAGLNLSWPFAVGGQNDARRAREMAQARLLQAQHDDLLLTLRQTLLETHEEIQFLRDTERKAAEVNAGYRDWALERARAEYEMEMKTNLGTSMADTQVAKLRRRAVEYRLALAWERLDGLMGADAGLPLETRE
jgi:outer membrane protein TolC